MIERDGKRRKWYVYNTKDIYKHTCPINGTRHSSDECTVLGDFGSKYSKTRPNKDRGNDPADKTKFNIQKNKNDTVNNALDDIIPQKNNKVSAESEAHENIDVEIKN